MRCVQRTACGDGLPRRWPRAQARRGARHKGGCLQTRKGASEGEAVPHQASLASDCGTLLATGPYVESRSDSTRSACQGAPGSTPGVPCIDATREAPGLNCVCKRHDRRSRAAQRRHLGLLCKRLAELEEKTELIDMRHDSFSRNTRNQLKQVFDALRELTVQPEPTKRPIGFVTPEDKKTPKTRGKK